MLVLLPFTACPHLKQVDSLGKYVILQLYCILTGKLSDPVSLLLDSITQQIFKVCSSSLYQCCGFFLFVLLETTAISQAVFTGYRQCRVDTAYTVEAWRIPLLQVVSANLLWSLQLQKRTSLPFSISLCLNLFFISASKRKVPRLLCIH